MKYLTIVSISLVLCLSSCQAKVDIKPDPSNVIIQAPAGEGIWVRNGELMKSHKIFYQNKGKLVPGQADILVGAPMQIGSLK